MLASCRRERRVIHGNSVELAELWENSAFRIDLCRRMKELSTFIESPRLRIIDILYLVLCCMYVLNIARRSYL